MQKFVNWPVIRWLSALIYAFAVIGQPGSCEVLVLSGQNQGIPRELSTVESGDALNSPVSLEVDARHLACPLPLLKAKQGLRAIAAGELIRVLSTDTGSLRDFVSFTQLTGQVLERFSQQDGYYCFVIRKQS